MIDLRVAQPTLVEAADGGGGGGRASRDEREEGQNSNESIHSLSHTGSDIYAIHGAAEGHYSWG